MAGDKKGKGKAVVTKKKRSRAVTLILNLVIIGPKFQCAVDEKVVGFVDIFPTALVSFNLD